MDQEQYGDFEQLKPVEFRAEMPQVEDDVDYFADEEQEDEPADEI